MRHVTFAGVFVLLTAPAGAAEPEPKKPTVEDDAAALAQDKGGSVWRPSPFATGPVLLLTFSREPAAAPQVSFKVIGADKPQAAVVGTWRIEEKDGRRA